MRRHGLKRSTRMSSLTEVAQLSDRSWRRAGLDVSRARPAAAKRRSQSDLTSDAPGRRLCGALGAGRRVASPFAVRSGRLVWSSIRRLFFQHRSRGAVCIIPGALALRQLDVPALRRHSLEHSLPGVSIRAAQFRGLALCGSRPLRSASVDVVGQVISLTRSTTTPKNDPRSIRIGCAGKSSPS